MKQFNSIYSLKKRLLAILIAVAFIFCLLSARLIYLQVFNRQKLQGLALDQWTRDLPISATRGKILDRNGVILADVETAYDLYLRPRMVDDKVKTAEILALTLNVDKNKLYEKLTTKSVSEFAVKKCVDSETMKSVQNLAIKGLYYTITNVRYYPYGDLLAQVLGFTSSDGSGQSGMELYYNQILSGIDGKLLTETDLLGIETDNSSTYFYKGVDGLNVELTIDYEIQTITENALKRACIAHSPKSASAIVLDPNSGEIIAMASLPSLNLNDLPRDNLQELNKLSRNTLVVDIYEPGSTFKTLTASANVEEYFRGNKDAFSLEHVFSSSPIRVIDGQTIKCWDKHLNGRHSNETLKEALQNSCNPVFVDIAVSLGKDKFYEYLKKFGYGNLTGVDYIGEANGMLIPLNQVKNCDLARIGFGQTIAVSALQLINATSSVINGGILYKPTLLKAVSEDSGRVLYSSYPTVLSKPISDKTSEIMRSYLQNVVENGSGYHAKIDGVGVGGKTGTAQKYVDGKISQGKYISSFVGFYPTDSPKYVCLVLIDEPVGIYYGSTVAAPIAKEIFEGILRL